MGKNTKIPRPPFFFAAEDKGLIEIFGEFTDG